MPAKTSVASTTGTPRAVLTLLPRALSGAVCTGRIGAAALVVLVAQSIWWDDVPLALQLACTGLAVLSYFRPADGLLVVAGLSPLGVIVARQLHGGHVRFSEAMVLAFLAGWLIRTTRPGPARVESPPRLVLPVAVFGAVVLASTIEQLFVYQVWQDFPLPYVQGFWSFLTQHYFTDVIGYWHVPVAALLLEGSLLLVAVVGIATADVALPRRLLRMVVAGAIGAALVNISVVSFELVAGQDPIDSLRRISNSRWTVHIGDVNAAGSYFALMTFLAFGAMIHARRHVPWLIGGCVVALALRLTASLSALAGLLVALFALPCWLFVGGWRPHKTMVIKGSTALLVLTLAGGLLIARTPSLLPLNQLSGAARPVEFRLMFLEAGLRMSASRPWFGVGIGQYYLNSAQFSSPELLEAYPRENAHNNFLQLSAEMGIVGLGSFLWLIGSILWRAGMTSTPSWILGGLFGLVAFLVSCLGNHPLLVPEVAYAFWLALGVVATASPLTARSDKLDEVTLHAPLAGLPSKSTSLRSLTVVGLILLGVSVPGRISGTVAEIDLANVEYGFHVWETDLDGRRFRWTTRLARLHLPATVSSVDIPIRALHLDPAPRSITVSVSFDGHLVEEISLEDDAWRVLSFDLPEKPEGDVYTFDIALPYTWRPADVVPGSSDERQLGIQVGELTLRTQ